MLHSIPIETCSRSDSVSPLTSAFSNVTDAVSSQYCRLNPRHMGRILRIMLIHLPKAIVVTGTPLIESSTNPARSSGRSEAGVPAVTEEITARPKPSRAHRIPISASEVKVVALGIRCSGIVTPARNAMFEV